MNYGQKIADLRKGSKLTQADLGKKLNVTAQAVSKWENDLSEPDIDSIKKMCEIFNVSINEFLEIAPTQTEGAAPQPATQQTVVCFCENCNKPLNSETRKITHYSYNPSSPNYKVKKTDIQHFYCPDCIEIIKKEKARQDKRIAEEKEKQEQLELKARKERYNAEEKEKKERLNAEEKKELNRGLIWGGVIAGILLAICLITYFVNPANMPLWIAIVLPILTFTFTSQMFWWGVVMDFFLFFCRSFKAPFGLIFELSLYGIIWLLTVKLALWIICGLLSILFFLLGLVLSLIFSIFAFPFALGSKIKNS